MVRRKCEIRRQQVPVGSDASTPAGWKAYDVRIEGVSYVQNYRNQFNAEVAAKGLDALITRLEQETAAIDAGRKQPDRPSAATPAPALDGDN